MFVSLVHSMSIHSSGSLTEDKPVPLSLPSATAVCTVAGTILFDQKEETTVNISVGNTIWSQAVPPSGKIVFQTICIGAPTLLVTGFVGGASYTYTATKLR